MNVVYLRHEIALGGWRPTDLARAAGVSPGTMTLVMKGGRFPPRTVRRIASAMRKHATVPGLGELLDEAAA